MFNSTWIKTFSCLQLKLLCLNLKFGEQELDYMIFKGLLQPI